MMRPAPKRLGHRKTRTGCVRCKARHVKCDEHRPCHNCVRFNVPCSLTQDSPASPVATQVGNHVANTLETQSHPNYLPGNHSENLLAHNNPVPTGHQQCPSMFVSPSDCPEAVTWMQSLRLLHHYDTEVSQILAHDQSARDVWRKIVPEAAFNNDFLMYGLLALSAMHYAQSHASERREYNLISSHYQSLAVQRFTTKLQDITKDNFEPYFFLATFIFVISMCSIADWRDPTTPPPLSDIAQSFVLLQGVKSICEVRPMETWSSDGPLSPLLHEDKPLPQPRKRRIRAPSSRSESVSVSGPSSGPGSGADPSPNSGPGSGSVTDVEEVDAPLPFQSRMEQLYSLARDLTPNFSVINVQSSCLLAIESLRTTHAACTARDDSMTSRARRIWLWPASLTHLFIELISSKHHVALIVLAHYAALSWPFEHPQWMNRGWSANIIASVEKALDERWLEWIAWPKKAVQEHIHVDELEIFPELG